MLGLMMDTPLLISAILRHAEREHGEREVVSATATGLRHRISYADAFRRARRLANALDRLGVERGDRVATLAFSDHRHLEIVYAVSCSGRVCHTINPRLFDDEIAYIARHAEDRVLFLDPAFLPLVERLADRLDSVAGFVLLAAESEMPTDSTLPGLACYETLLAAEGDGYDWPTLDERTASSLCYTSGTTGHPKGVLYSHRSTVLHTYAAALPDAMGLGARDVALPVAPMFHVNAWGLPYSAPMVGAKLVLPGPYLGDPGTLQALIEEEGVTFAAGVPTVWLGLVDHLERSGKGLGRLERVVIGGSACPPSLRHG